MAVAAVSGLVMVLNAETPMITLNSIRSQAVDEYDLSRGVHLFPDLIVDATTKTEHNERASDSNVCITTRDTSVSADYRPFYPTLIIGRTADIGASLIVTAVLLVGCVRGRRSVGTQGDISP